MTEPNWWADELAYARRDAQRDEHAAHRTYPRPVWSHATADDWDEISPEDYR